MVVRPSTGLETNPQDMVGAFLNSLTGKSKFESSLRRMNAAIGYIIDLDKILCLTKG